MRAVAALIVVMTLAAGGCGGGGLTPANFDAAREPCRFCRMTGSNGRSAAQIVAPGEEPLFFDDIGCLREYVKGSRAAAGAVWYVADHGSGAWIRADRAVYARNDAVPTPMSSHVLAYASPAARDADPDGRNGTPTSPAEVFTGLSVPWSQDK
jgi:copper chaperone NosL